MLSNSLLSKGNSFEIKNILSSPEKQILFKSHYSVETFFFIRYSKIFYYLNISFIQILFSFLMNSNFESGLFTTYTILKYTNGKYEYLNKIGFLLSRFIRLTPQLAIFILLTSLLQFMGSGPVWNQQILPKINNCQKYWWQNLIYVQNLINPQNMVIKIIEKYILI